MSLNVELKSVARHYGRVKAVDGVSFAAGPGEVIPNGSVHRFRYGDGRLTLDRFNLGPEDRDLFTASVL